MKLSTLHLEELPEVKVHKEQVILDQLSIECNSYDFLVEVAKAYYSHVRSTEDGERAYKAIIEAVSEGIGIDILDDIETEVVKLREENAELREYLEEIEPTRSNY